jgi:hypothetical protein
MHFMKRPGRMRARADNALYFSSLPPRWLNETKIDVLACKTLLPKHHLRGGGRCICVRGNHILKFFSPHFLINHPAQQLGGIFPSKFPLLEICSRFEAAML